MIYLDNAATTIKKPDAVYDAVLDAMKHCGNSGRGMSDASLDASRKIYEARMCLTEFFGAQTSLYAKGEGSVRGYCAMQ